MNYQIFIKGEDKTDRIKSWQQFGNRIQIIYSDGKSYMYGESNVKIIPSALLDENANQCFEYLKSVVAAVSLENEQVGNILKNQYNKIDFVSSESILANFLTAKLPQRPTTVSNVVFPFGYNESQKIAVEKALANDLSIIEGPPGTGKTQTILNIIANAVMRGESVAVVSGNNSATKNVQEKLEKYSVDFISAYLGSVENKKIFIDNQENKPLPNLKEWRLSHEKKKEIETNLQFLSAQLDEKLKQKNRLANLTDEEAVFALNELTHFDFLIYDKISKHPRLVIEVDGVVHHKKGSPQSRRDDLKNAILDKIEIPIIRFATNGSDEKKQLRERLKTIIK